MGFNKNTKDNIVKNNIFLGDQKFLVYMVSFQLRLNIRKQEKKNTVSSE